VQDGLVDTVETQLETASARRAARTAHACATAAEAAIYALLCGKPLFQATRARSMAHERSVWAGQRGGLGGVL